MTSNGALPIEQRPDPLTRVAEIADLIASSAAASEAAGVVVPEVDAALKARNMFRLLLPKSYGGDEIAPPDFFRVMEALARIDASTAWCVGQLNGCNMSAAYVAPEIARDLWGNPNSALSWGPPGRSRAERVPGGWRVSGRWDLASGCRHATIFGMQCQAFEKDGRPAVLPGGRNVITLLAPKKDITLLPNWNVMGLRATSSDSFTAENLFVPDERAIVRDEPSLRRQDGPLYVYPAMLLYAHGFSAAAIGVAGGMLDAFLKLAAEKAARGMATTLRENPGIQTDVAIAEARLRAARALVLGTAERIWTEVKATRALTLAHRMDIRLAATHAIHEAKAAADIAYDAAGSTAIYADQSFERRHRDIHTMTQQVQGRRLHYQNVGGYLMGLAPDLTFA